MKLKIKNLFHESSKEIHDFKVFKIARSFGDTIYKRKFEIHEANQEQADSLEYILSFNNKTIKNKSRSDEDKNKKMFLTAQEISLRVEN